MNVARSVASRCARSVARRVTDVSGGSSSPGHTTANGTASSLTIEEGDTLTIDAVITRDPAPWGANEVNYQLQFFDGGWDNVGTPEGSSDFPRGVSDLGDAGLWRIVVIDTVTSREYPLEAVSVSVLVSGATFPAASQFVFTDDGTGLGLNDSSLLLNRAGWMMLSSDHRSSGQATLNGTKITVIDGFSGRHLFGQDLGRRDGGSIRTDLRAATFDWTSFGYVSEADFFLLNVSSRNRIRISRTHNGVSTTIYDSGTITTLAASDVVRVDWSWSGSTITILLFINDVRYPNSITSWTESAISVDQPSGKVGIFSRGERQFWQSQTLASAPRLTLNKVNRIYQRHKTTEEGTVPVSGVGAGVTAIQFRLLQNGSVVSGWNWGDRSIIDFEADSVTGKWSGKIAAIPLGINYQIDVRDSVDNAAGSMSRMFDIGRIAIGWGQSLAVQIHMSSAPTGRTTTGQDNVWFLSGQSSNPFDWAREWEWSGKVPNGNNYTTGGNSGTGTFSPTALAQAVRTQFSGAFSWHSGGVGSTSLSEFLPTDEQSQYSSGPTRTLWQNFTSKLDWLGGDFECLIWDQGQENAGRTITGGGITAENAATYKTDFATLIAAIREYVGRTAEQLPVIVIPIGRIYPAGGVVGDYTVDPGYDRFFKAQIEMCEEVANCHLGPMQNDLQLATSTTNEVHLLGADLGYVEKSARIGYSIAKLYGATTDRRGPLPLSAARSGSQIAVTYDANSATAMTCAAAIASSLVFWTDNTYTTRLTPTAMSIGTLSGSQIVVTYTFEGDITGSPIVTSGKGGAYSIGGGWPDTENGLKGTQSDGYSVIAYPILEPILVS